MSHTSHHERRVVQVSPEQMFDLVADVERYPDFLPLISQAKIIRRDESAYETEQVLALGLIRHRFVSHTELQRPKAILVTSADRGFRRFEIRWSFAPTPEGFCLTEFAVDCEVRSLFLQPLATILVTDMATMMVSAFENRARKLGALTKR